MNNMSIKVLASSNKRQESINTLNKLIIDFPCNNFSKYLGKMGYLYNGDFFFNVTRLKKDLKMFQIFILTFGHITLVYYPKHVTIFKIF